jgi:hypothetical protein
MNRTALWKQLEEKKQMERDAVRADYQTTLSSIQKLETHLQRLDALSEEYHAQDLKVSTEQHFISQTQGVRNTIQQIMQLRFKTQCEMENMRTKLSQIQVSLEAFELECAKYRKLREQSERQSMLAADKKVRKETDAIALHLHLKHLY